MRWGEPQLWPFPPSTCLQRVRQSADILPEVRRDFPANYAARPLPGIYLASTPNSFVPDKAIKKARLALVGEGCRSRRGINAVVPGLAVIDGVIVAHAPASLQVGACSGCGLNSAELKFCSGCRTAQYCSRACQVN